MRSNYSFLLTGYTVFKIFGLLGTSSMFSSGSWATLNYLKLLPTPKSFTNSSSITSLSKGVFSKKPLFETPSLKNNDLSRNKGRNTSSNNLSILNSNSDQDILETRANSIFDFDVMMPIKVIKTGVIRCLHCFDIKA